MTELRKEIMEIIGGERCALSYKELDNFFKKVSVPRDQQNQIDFTQCWNWNAAGSRVGYGMFGWHDRMHVPHRIMLERIMGVMPEEHQTDVAHSCHNRICVCPTHLRWATRSENLNDMKDNPTPRKKWKKLSEQEVISMQMEYSTGKFTQEQLAIKYDVSITTVDKFLSKEMKNDSNSKTRQIGTSNNS